MHWLACVRAWVWWKRGRVAGRKKTVITKNQRITWNTRLAFSLQMITGLRPSLIFPKIFFLNILQNSHLFSCSFVTVFEIRNGTSVIHSRYLLVYSTEHHHRSPQHVEVKVRGISLSSEMGPFMSLPMAEKRRESEEARAIFLVCMDLVS